MLLLVSGTFEHGRSRYRVQQSMLAANPRRSLGQAGSANCAKSVRDLKGLGEFRF
jgi:hypothetical protein